MKIHHQKHHQTYVDGLNKSLEQIGGASHPQYITSVLSELKTIPESERNNINFFGGGFENHRLFQSYRNNETRKLAKASQNENATRTFSNNPLTRRTN